jgi:hypothetical protein
MIESIDPGEEVVDMSLRKNKSLLDETIDQASDVVEAALPVIATAMAQAKEQMVEIGQETKDKAAPILADTRSLADDVIQATKEVAIPKARATALSSAKAGADKAAELAELAAAKATQVADAAEAAAEPDKKSHKVRNTLILGSVIAVAGYTASKLRARGQSDNWQSSYTPPPAPSTSTSATVGAPAGGASGVPGSTGGAHLAPGMGPDEPIGADDPMLAHVAEGDDPGGASPDEAIADAVEEPHPVTTPDDPADVVDVEASESGKKK